MEITNTFSVDEIYSQVRRILDFSAFRNSPILSKFFKFIISETVQKNNQQIKEYSIAINVLDRPKNFNPHDDAVVRIHAGRLRRALNEYYFTKGISDAIVIEIPKGGYVPVFQSVKYITPKKMEFSSADDVAVENPVVAVFPFKINSHIHDEAEFAIRFGEQLSGELSRFRELKVIGYYSDEVLLKIEHNMLDAGKFIVADYILSGKILITRDNLRILLNLLVVSTGEVLMSRLFDKKRSLLNALEVDDQMVNEVAASIVSTVRLMVQCGTKASRFKDQ